jgi:hypothetical protein
MIKRFLYTIICSALLAVSASVLCPTDAQAMAAGCCCPAESCGCGCSDHGPDKISSGLQISDSAARAACTCSTGPNPFGTDEALVTVYVDPLKKKFFHTLAKTSAAAFPATADPPLKRYKPPAIACRPLYLLKNAFLI